jgi:uncharacterized protein (DUF58 family)
LLPRWPPSRFRVEEAADAMSPTWRAALLLVAAAALAVVLDPAIAALVMLAIAVATVVDASAARARPEVERTAARTMARGMPGPLTIAVEPPARVRQPQPPDITIAPAQATAPLTAVITPHRRGRHELLPPVVRRVGPLGLGRFDHTMGAPTELLVYPDLPAARRLALAVRQGRFVEEGLRRRGPLGLGTDFESIRDYTPDDDIRRVNWKATARLNKPMTNQYRVDQDRDVICVIDTGRLMAAPVGDDRTRLDVALDALVAVALVADEVGDRCGAVAFAQQVLRRISPRRAGGRAVVDALFDLEPVPLDSDYDAAFHVIGRQKRALVVVFTDLLDDAAARTLLAAAPVLCRRHAVVVASVRDADLEASVLTRPENPLDAYEAVVAGDALAARRRAVADLQRAGATVVEADPHRLAAACVRAYLQLKARARL